ncbi:MAG: tRNA (adenosine(37)-N6)-threonylcarbamoyltransferase complex dimerization subunit type 1 TsaB [Clostridiaceae bacterium]|nr:tRNA (adenosine(37)-N6)-threonylcarbamoyltransferase complex dimerization subunit type 1 TsaB [Clostridiaceae bacterium]
MTDKECPITQDFYMLAFDTSGKSLSIAILKEEKLLVEKFLNINHQHSINFLPALEQVMKMVELEYSQLSAIATTIGPGSFTGIRIGISTANTMAFDLDIPVIGVSSLRALAEPFISTEKYLLPAFDARGGRVYAALYKDGKEIIADRQFVETDLPNTLSKRELKDKPLLLIGDGSDTSKTLLQDAGFNQLKQLKNTDRINQISAEAVARIAIEKIKAKPTILENKYRQPITANYCAITQAERNLKKLKEV